MSTILLLDIGNSRIKSAVWNGRALKPGETLEHHGKPSAALSELALPEVQSLWISHVTGAAHEPPLMRAAKKHLGLLPNFARSEARRFGLKNSYREAQRLGVDRWLALLGAWQHGGGPLCVADAGTALTVDCVDAKGRHLGGFIAPGLLTAQKAVLGNTRFATRKINPRYSAALGRDTETCVQQGAYLACLGAIDRGSAVAGAHARKIITGGDARTLLRHLDAGWEHRPLLVLEGLLALALSA